jgi:hypothetical protein
MSVDGIFSRPMIATANDKSARAKAAQSFGAIFTSMVAAAMRRAMVGEDKGPMGIGGGASGDIYGAMFDQAIGASLARSPSMKRFNDSIERELDGAAMRRIDRAHATFSESELVSRTVAVRDTRDFGHVPASVHSAPAHKSRIEQDRGMPVDNRGPLLLPPQPSAMAPNLPPPSQLEG